MGQLRTAKAGDKEAFPASTFVVEDTPPITQCQETQITGANGFTSGAAAKLRDDGAFVGIDLTDKILTITSPPGNAGDYPVLSNDDNFVYIATVLTINSGANVYAVHDPGQAYLTRNQPSFLRFIEEEAQAHTTKGGQLFTDTPSPPMNAACSDTFDPQ